MASEYPSIPDPGQTPETLITSLRAIKKCVELIVLNSTGQFTQSGVGSSKHVFALASDVRSLSNRVGAGGGGGTVDTSGFVQKAGDTMTGPLTLPGDPTQPLQASDKSYVDAQAAAALASANTHSDSADTAQNSAIAAKADKTYVDTQDTAVLTSANVHSDNSDATQNTVISTKADKTYVDTQNTAVLNSANVHSDNSDATQNTVINTKAPLASPTLTGIPAAPTAAPGTNTTQISTTAFVTAAIAAVGGGVSQAYVDQQDALRVAKAGDTMSGDLTIAKANPVVILRKAASGQYNSLTGFSGLTARWAVLPGDQAPETGAQVGSNFAINRYNDSGAFVDAPLTINRATGLPTFLNRVEIKGTGAGSVLDLNSTPGQSSIVRGLTSGTLHWSLQIGDGSAMTGGNVGDDFSLVSFNDAGALLYVPFGVRRSDGLVSISKGLNVSGTTNLGNTSINGGSFATNAGINASFNGYVSINQSCEFSGPMYAKGQISFHYNSDASQLDFLDSPGTTRWGMWGATVNYPLYVRNTSSSPAFYVDVNGNAWSAVGGILTSDAREKENVIPITEALAKVNALRGVYYNYIATPERQRIGFIAQEVRPIVPQVIVEQGLEPGKATTKYATPTLAMGPADLTALLVEAVKELTAQNKDLIARVELLESNRAAR